MWRVDTSEAPKDHPDLAGTVQEIQERLNDQAFVKSLCIHESAHTVYWAFLGQETIPDYTIRICQRGIEYAAVTLVNPEQPKAWTPLELAKAHAAGGVASGILAPGYDAGDLQDHENFKVDMLVVTQASLSDIEAVWDMACDELRVELTPHDSAIRLEIQTKAIDFERNFRLVSEIGKA